MKRLMLTCAVLTAAVMAFADQPARPRRTRPDAHSRPSGGMVEKAYNGNVLRVLDAQKAIPHEKIADMVKHMRWATLLPFETVRGEAPDDMIPLQSAAKKLVAEEKVGAGVIVIDKPNLPFKIYSDESNWSILNIAFLKADSPIQAKLENRAEKMIWKALARSLNVGAVAHSMSVLQPFKTLADLDANLAMRPCPDGFNAFINNGKVYGITTLTMSSYRDACHKGWAPPPANKIQQKIWDEIHAIPDKPITIEFDPKKDK